MPYLEGGAEALRVSRSFERLCLLFVVQLYELLNRPLEILDGLADAAPELAASQFPEMPSTAFIWKQKVGV